MVLSKTVLQHHSSKTAFKLCVRTWRDMEGLERTWEEQERTLKVLKGLGGTWKDSEGLEITWKVMSRLERTWEALKWLERWECDRQTDSQTDKVTTRDACASKKNCVSLKGKAVLWLRGAIHKMNAKFCPPCIWLRKWLTALPQPL